MRVLRVWRELSSGQQANLKAFCATLGFMIKSKLENIGSNVGWSAKLHLNFIEKDKKTVIKQRTHQGPLYVQKPFYPEGNGACHVYLLHPPGGVVGGDHFDVKIDVNLSAKVLVTTPAACKFYRSGGATAYQKQSIKVATHGALEWFPSENIFFSGAKAKLETTVDLSEKSHFIGWDILCLGRPAAREQFSQGNLVQRFNIFQSGRPVRLDKLVIRGNDPALGAKWGLAGKPVLGNFFCFTQRIDLVDILRKNVYPLEKEDFYSVTFVDNIILCRYLGNSVEQVKRHFIKVWQFLRLALRGHEAVIPRIWST